MRIPQPVTTAFSALLRLPPPPDPPPGDETTAVVFRASPKYLRYRTALWALGAIPLLLGGALPLAAAVLQPSPQRTPVPDPAVIGAVALGLVLVAVIVWWLLIRLDYAWRWYVVTDRSLRVREGIWHVREMTITFANVQNISIEQGPLERLFGVSNVRVDTAGGGAVTSAMKTGHAGLLPNLHTARMRGLDTAESVRTAIQQRLRGNRDAGLGDPEESASLPSSSGIAVSPDALWAAAALVEEARALHAAARLLESNRIPAGRSA